MFPSSRGDAGFWSSQLTDDQMPNLAKVCGEQGLMSFTVKQLSEAHHSGDDESGFTIDGVVVTNVTLLGRVCEKTARMTDVIFLLDDGTGRVECLRWVNEAADSREMEGVSEGMYVRVFGHLRSLQGRRRIVAFAVRPVVNFDEVTFHFVDCIHQHLKKLKLKTGAISNPQKVEPSSSFSPINSSNGNTITSAHASETGAISNPQKVEPPSSLSPINTSKGNTITSAHANELLVQFPGNYTIDGLKGSDQKVLEFLQNFAQEKGVHRDEISRQLNISADKIMASLKTLEAEGLIYSTIDEYHYKSTKTKV